METHQVLEAAMLLCFSTGWYWSIARMLRVRSAHGKSPAFVSIVLTGYTLGAVSKLAAWTEIGVLSPLVWLYAWNALVVAADLALVVRLRSRDARARRGCLGAPPRPNVAGNVGDGHERRGDDAGLVGRDAARRFPSVPARGDAAL